MKIFSKKRLQIVDSPESVLIRWWKLSGFDIVLFVFLCVHTIYGLGIAFGFEKVLDVRAIELNSMGWMVYWVVAILGWMHVFFNRIVSLNLSSQSHSYKVGIIPGVKARFHPSDINECRLVRKVDHFAEVPVTYDNLDSYHLEIYLVDRKRPLKIKGLSQEDALFVKDQFSRFWVNV